MHPAAWPLRYPFKSKVRKTYFFLQVTPFVRYSTPIPLDSVARNCYAMAESHQTRALPPVCPWRIEIVRVVLLGTHDAQSPLHQLQGQRSVLELIIRGWAWPEVLVNSARLWAPELFLDVLMAEMLAANPGVTEAKLREGLGLNPDGSIHSWHLGGYLSGCGLRALPELFGAVRTSGDLRLDGNQLSSLPDSFGSITVGGSLVLDRNQLSSLPDSFGSITVGLDLGLCSNQLSCLPASFGFITVGRELSLYNNQLQDQDIPGAFPNVSGDVFTKW